MSRANAQRGVRPEELSLATSYLDASSPFCTKRPTRLRSAANLIISRLGDDYFDRIATGSAR